jgi:hypothetical protein
MKDAKKIVDFLKKYVEFKNKTDEEEVMLYFYTLYKWAHDRGRDIVIVTKELAKKVLLITILFKNTGGVIYDLDSFNVCLLEIQIKGTPETFKKEIKEALAQYLELMKELYDRNDGLDSFLEEGDDNIFF